MSNRQNVSTNFKFGDTDGFMLTDLDTDETLMLIPCDTAGNFSWTGVTRAPLQRNAMKTSNTSNQYSDLEPPWISIPQENWTGGRGNYTFTKDTTRYLDGKRAQAAFNEVIYNGPLDYYSTGFRKAETNCPGSMSWKKMLPGKERYIAVTVTPKEDMDAGELYIHLRRRGTPASSLVVELVTSLTSDEPLASHTYTLSEITDTLSEFAKFTFDSVALTAETDYFIRIHCDAGTMDDHWEIGCKANCQEGSYYSSNGITYDPANFEVYYRVAEEQVGYRSMFFTYEQIPFMVRQIPNSGQSELWMNGMIALATGATGTTIKTIPYGQYRPYDDTDPEPYPDPAVPDVITWETDQWKGARIGLVYGPGIDGQISVWRTIAGNTADTITVDKAWDITPEVYSYALDRWTYTTFIVVDTSIWTKVAEFEGNVTDVEVVAGSIYLAFGDYIPYKIIKWNRVTGQFGFRKERYIIYDRDELTVEDDALVKAEFLCATYIKSVRDSSGLVIWRARNDARSYQATYHEGSNNNNYYTVKYGSVRERVIDKAYVLDPVDNLSWGWNQTTAITGSTGDVFPKVNYANIDGSPFPMILDADFADFYYPDINFKQYKITIGTFTSTKNTGVLAVTLQESPDNYNWTDVASMTCTCVGTFYLHAHCHHRFRRIKLSASGTNVSVNNIIITVSNATNSIFSDAIVLKDNYGKITKLFEYGAEQSKSLWVVQEGMLSSVNKVDGTKDTYTLDRINIDELQATSEEWNGKAINTTDVYLLWAWLNGLQRYYNTQLEGKGPDHDEGLPFERQGRITQIVSYPSNFFICIDAEDGFSSVMQFNQSGWHEIYRAPNAGEQIHDMCFQPIYGPRPDRLWVNVGDDIIWLTMPSKILYAIQDQFAEYTHEGVLISAWHTAGMTDIEKLWQTMKIMADYLDGTNCWIEADYQTDEETIWHPIENWYTVSPSQKEDLNPYGSVNGKKLRYRLRLQTTDIHKTPKVNVVVLECVGRVDIKMSYNFYFRNIKYKRDLNAEFEDIEPLEVQDLLDKWANDLKKLRLNSRWKIFDDKIVYLDAVQTSVLNELSEGYIGQLTLNEL